MDTDAGFKINFLQEDLESVYAILEDVIAELRSSPNLGEIHIVDDNDNVWTYLPVGLDTWRVDLERDGHVLRSEVFPINELRDRIYSHNAAMVAYEFDHLSPTVIIW